MIGVAAHIGAGASSRHGGGRRGGRGRGGGRQSERQKVGVGTGRRRRGRGRRKRKETNVLVRAPLGALATEKWEKKKTRRKIKRVMSETNMVDNKNEFGHVSLLFWHCIWLVFPGRHKSSFPLLHPLSHSLTYKQPDSSRLLLTHCILTHCIHP